MQSMSSTPYPANNDCTTSDGSFLQLSALLKASSDVLRLEILRVLDKKSFGVQELCKIFAIRQPAISHHLKLLAQTGLVATRREGNSIFYHRHHQAPAALPQGLWQNLMDAVDALPLRPDLLTRVAMVLKDRAASSQQFFEQHAKQFRGQQEQIADYQQYMGPVKQFIDTAQLPGRDLALEIGPGAGAFLTVLSPAFKRVLACDISPSMLALARECAHQQQLDNIEFILCDSAELLTQPLRPDCIVANMVLHHVPSPADMVQDVAALLSPGGSFFLAELCRHDQTWARDACGDLWLGLDPDDLTRWAQGAGLQQGRHLYFAQRNGFSVQIRQFTKPALCQQTATMATDKAGDNHQPRR
jgi:ubiquinone/menaquinone biosynthesis C-methylase UbiE/DNA-binding transcriptional ArsR family regulator